MNVFLAATDLSERSDRAVRRALRLARAHHAACHVLHVVDEALPPDMAGRLRNEAEAWLARFVAAEPDGSSATCSAVIGDPVAAIAEAARRLDAGIVVFGLHRPRTFLDTLRETSVERMVRLVARPALLVRDPADHDYARILAPVSFSPACAKALSAARDLAPKAEIAGIHAVHLPFEAMTFDHPGGSMERALIREAEATRTEWCAAQGLADELCAVSPVTGSLGEVIDRRIRSFKPDLIALGVHTRNRLAPHTVGSFAAALLRDPPTDILLAHP